jgi:hypothetical protein
MKTPIKGGKASESNGASAPLLDKTIVPIGLRGSISTRIIPHASLDGVKNKR